MLRGLPRDRPPPRARRRPATARSPPGKAATNASHSSAARSHAARRPGPERARARRRPRSAMRARPARHPARRRRSRCDVEPRAGDCVALLGRLAQIAGALRDVRLDPGADGTHAGDPDHVVGTQLDPVERLRDGCARASSSRRRRRSSASSAPRAPIHCGSDELATSGAISCRQRGGELIVSLPECQLRLAHTAEDQDHPDQLRPGRSR